MATSPRYLRWRHRQAAVLIEMGWKTRNLVAQFLRLAPHGSQAVNRSRLPRGYGEGGSGGPARRD